MEIILYLVAIASMLVIFQDAIVFPGAFFGWLHGKAVCPDGVEQLFVPRDHNKRIEVWRYAPGQTEQAKKYVALIFAGNGRDVSGFFSFQQWFAEMGITSYAMNYRGYGESDWYPTEQGILSDARLVTEEVLKREKITAEQLIVFSFSLGSGIGSYIANVYRVHALFVLAGYSSTREVAQDRWLVGYLRPFLWTNFRAQQNIAELNETKIVFAHGLQDREILPRHTEINAQAYRGVAKSVIIHPSAEHNNLFSQVREQLSYELKRIVEN